LKQGCDASVLLNKTATIDSEQDAAPNSNSLRGLDVINRIKAAVEIASQFNSSFDLFFLSSSLKKKNRLARLLIIKQRL
jgi:hypothetical protein